MNRARFAFAATLVGAALRRRRLLARSDAPHGSADDLGPGGQEVHAADSGEADVDFTTARDQAREGHGHHHDSGEEHVERADRRG